MLLGSRSYDFAVDMWALGCVCVEMVGRAIAFPGIKEFKGRPHVGVHLSIVWHTGTTPLGQSYKVAIFQT